MKFDNGTFQIDQIEQVKEVEEKQRPLKVCEDITVEIEQFRRLSLSKPNLMDDKAKQTETERLVKKIATKSKIKLKNKGKVAATMAAFFVNMN